MVPSQYRSNDRNCRRTFCVHFQQNLLALATVTALVLLKKRTYLNLLS